MKVFSEFGIDLELLDNFVVLLDQVFGIRSKKSIKSLWVCVVWVVLWAIWKEKNSRIFNKEYASVSKFVG